MKYIVATTDNEYFRWQMLVQINNFKRNNILDDLTYVVSVNNKVSKKLNNLKKETGVRIITYRDERVNSQYQSSIRPHILKKHFLLHPEESKIYYYLDPDVIFLRKPNYPSIYYKTNKWILSDTRSYLSSKYIKSKSEELFKLMCKTVNIDINLVMMYDNLAGGAQYILKNVDGDFWGDVEVNSEKLYKIMKDSEHKYSPNNPIQSWTADMWAILWTGWKLNYKTIIDKDMDFIWATDHLNLLNDKYIYHNAGVTNQKDLFNKCLFVNNNPFNEDFSYINENYSSYLYVKEIINTKNNYNSLIKKL